VALLYETHVLEPGNAIAVGWHAVRGREAGSALRCGPLLHLFKEPQMRVRHHRGQDRLCIGVADFCPDPLADRVDALRGVHASLGDFRAGYFRQRSVVLGLVRRV
jgi:hypothetical protein